MTFFETVTSIMVVWFTASLTLVALNALRGWALDRLEADE